MAKSKDVFILHEKEKQKTLKMQVEQQDKMHKQRMEELEYRRESERRYHSNEMERFRIKNAEAQKMQIRKEQFFDRKQKFYK